jgi:hypothetical protein
MASFVSAQVEPRNPFAGGRRAAQVPPPASPPETPPYPGPTGPVDSGQAAQVFDGLYDSGTGARGARRGAARRPAGRQEEGGAWDFDRPWRSAEDAFAAATGSGGGEVPFRGEMEQAFGQDFSSVRTHFGRRVELAALGAHAATDGERVAFADTAPDRRTVAHELAHVAQRRNAGGGGVRARSVSAPGDAAEQEAEQAAEQVAGGRQAEVRAAPGAALHRQEMACEPAEAGWEGRRGLNDAEHRIDERGRDDTQDEPLEPGAVRRVPLTLPTQPPRTRRAVAIVPDESVLAGLEQIDVVIHYHGHNKGYEGRDPADVGKSDIPQQVAASGLPVIVIMPQFAEEDEALRGEQATPAGQDSYRDATTGRNAVDPDQLVAEVFAALCLAQRPGRMILSGHSAGGPTAVSAAQGQEDAAGLFLFDGHVSTPDTLIEEDEGDWSGLLAERLARDHERMRGMVTAAGAPDEERQRQYLQQEGFFFRAYGTAGTYEGFMEPVDELLSDWFAEESHIEGVAPALLQAWRGNYEVRPGGTGHSTAISTGGASGSDYEPGTGHLEEALTDERNRPQLQQAPDSAIQRQEATGATQDQAQDDIAAVEEQEDGAQEIDIDVEAAIEANNDEEFRVDWVRRLQAIARADGQMLSQDGSFDEETVRWIAARQRGWGMDPTGVIDAATRARIEQEHVQMQDPLLGPHLQERVLVPASASEAERYQIYRQIIANAGGAFRDGPGKINLLGIRGVRVLRDGGGTEVRQSPSAQEFGQAEAEAMEDPDARLQHFGANPDRRAAQEDREAHSGVDVSAVYDDLIVSLWIDDQGEHARERLGSVDPGSLNKDEGTAHLRDGQYMYQLGRHTAKSTSEGHHALIDGELAGSDVLDVEVVPDGNDPDTETERSYRALVPAQDVEVLREEPGESGTDNNFYLSPEEVARSLEGIYAREGSHVGGLGINVHTAPDDYASSQGCTNVPPAEGYVDLIDEVRQSANSNRVLYMVIDASKVELELVQRQELDPGASDG